MPTPEAFENVTATVKGNVYFDGGVVSHGLTFPDGSKKTLGLIFPGTYRFDTAAPETMDITEGTCRVRLAGAVGWTDHAAGASFDVPGDSAFEIAVDAGVCQYVCSFR